MPSPAAPRQSMICRDRPIGSLVGLMTHAKLDRAQHRSASANFAPHLATPRRRFRSSYPTGRQSHRVRLRKRASVTSSRDVSVQKPNHPTVFRS